MRKLKVLTIVISRYDEEGMRVAVLGRECMGGGSDGPRSENADMPTGVPQLPLPLPVMYDPHFRSVAHHPPSCILFPTR